MATGEDSGAREVDIGLLQEVPRERGRRTVGGHKGDVTVSRRGKALGRELEDVQCSGGESMHPAGRPGFARPTITGRRPVTP